MPLEVRGEVELRNVTFAYPQRPGVPQRPMHLPAAGSAHLVGLPERPEH